MEKYASGVKYISTRAQENSGFAGRQAGGLRGETIHQLAAQGGDRLRLVLAEVARLGRIGRQVEQLVPPGFEVVHEFALADTQGGMGADLLDSEIVHAVAEAEVGGS